MRASTLAIIVALLLLAACGNDHEDVRAWMADASKDMQGRVQPIPEIKPFPIISYDAGDLPDPFSPSKITPRRAGEPDLDRPREPLEDYPLETIKMVGSMVKNKEKKRYALVQVGNTIYQVRVGNHIGQDLGTVTAITDTQVLIKELVLDPTGQTEDWVERPATLELQEQSQSQKETKR